MKTNVRNGFASALLCIGIAGEAIGQGSLTPPSGTPAPTMRTLLQVEPRTPISELPYAITAPGSYYLTTNLVTLYSGISISASDVTVDLMGFSIAGDRGPIDKGIFVDGKTEAPCCNIVIRNGVVKNFGYGLMLVSAQNSLLEYVTVSDSDRAGIVLDGSYGGDCSGNRIANCRVSGSVYSGIDLYANYSGKCDDNSISDCTFRKNATEGVRIYAGYGQCNQNSFRNCMIQDNAAEGVNVQAFSGGSGCGNVIESCNISGNANNGIYLYGEGGTVVGNRISLCTLYNNTYYGIRQYYGGASQINGNLVSGTRGDSPCGIYVQSPLPNLVVQNICVGQTNNFDIGSAATYGPIVTASGALSTTNGAAGLSPWANFSR